MTTRTNVGLLLLLLGLLPSPLGCSQQTAEVSSVVEFCHFELEEFSKQAFADYQVVAMFRVVAGRPSNIRITNDRLGIEEAVRRLLEPLAGWFH